MYCEIIICSERREGQILQQRVPKAPTGLTKFAPWHSGERELRKKKNTNDPQSPKSEMRGGRRMKGPTTSRTLSRSPGPSIRTKLQGTVGRGFKKSRDIRRCRLDSGGGGGRSALRQKTHPDKREQKAPSWFGQKVRRKEASKLRACHRAEQKGSP